MQFPAVRTAHWPQDRTPYRHESPAAPGTASPRCGSRSACDPGPPARPILVLALLLACGFLSKGDGFGVDGPFRDALEAHINSLLPGVFRCRQRFVAPGDEFKETFRRIAVDGQLGELHRQLDRKSTRLNSSH